MKPIIPANTTRGLIDKVFHDYFLKYNFKEEVSTNELNAFRHEYGNSHCNFIFSTGYSEIELDIQKAGDNYKYSVFSIYRYTKDKHLDVKDEPSHGTEDRITKQLIAYKSCLEKDFSQLPNGDFSWVETVKECVELEKKINEKLFSLSNKHAIYIKYDNDDPTWKVDIMKLLNEE